LHFSLSTVDWPQNPRIARRIVLKAAQANFNQAQTPSGHSKGASVTLPAFAERLELSVSPTSPARSSNVTQRLITTGEAIENAFSRQSARRSSSFFRTAEDINYILIGPGYDSAMLDGDASAHQLPVSTAAYYLDRRRHSLSASNGSLPAPPELLLTESIIDLLVLIVGDVFNPKHAFSAKASAAGIELPVDAPIDLTFLLALPPSLVINTGGIALHVASSFVVRPPGSTVLATIRKEHTEAVKREKKTASKSSKLTPAVGREGRHGSATSQLPANVQGQ
jgi:hypothetical protein